MYVYECVCVCECECIFVKEARLNQQWVMEQGVLSFRIISYIIFLHRVPAGVLEVGGGVVNSARPEKSAIPTQLN